MNKLQKILGIGAIVLSLTGCRETEEYSEIKHENAVVSYRQYRKAHTYRSMILVRAIIPITRHYPERWYINFDGNIDFEVDNKEIYNRFDNTGDVADISYKEFHASIYNTNKNGKEELIWRGRSIYEFVDAQPATLKK